MPTSSRNCMCEDLWSGTSNQWKIEHVTVNSTILQKVERPTIRHLLCPPFEKHRKYIRWPKSCNNLAFIIGCSSSIIWAGGGLSITHRAMGDVGSLGLASAPRWKRWFHHRFLIQKCIEMWEMCFILCEEMWSGIWIFICYLIAIHSFRCFHVILVSMWFQSICVESSDKNRIRLVEGIVPWGS